MGKVKEWLLDRQENGDDGTGFNDYVEAEGECDKCTNPYELSSKEGRCGDCGNCGDCCTHKEKEGK
jgi:hypothetical protein